MPKKLNFSEIIIVDVINFFSGNTDGRSSVANPTL
jgi:hypothetical protein